MLSVVAILAAVAIVLAVKGIKIVQHSKIIIVERLGKYHSTLESGINIIWPFIDKPRAIVWRFTLEGHGGQTVYLKKAVTEIDLRETVYDFPSQSVITADNVQIMINAVLYFQITDPVKAVYEVQDLPDAIEKLTQTSLRNVVGDMDLDKTLTSRDTINGTLRTLLEDATNKWGVKVNRVELDAVDLDAPFVGRIFEQRPQRPVDGVAAGEGLIEVHIAHDVTQARLGQLLDSVWEVLDLIDRFDRVGDLEVEHGVDHDLDIVRGDHALAREVIDRLAQVDLGDRLLQVHGLTAMPLQRKTPDDGTRFIDKRPDDVDAALEGRVILAEALDDDDFTVLDDLDAFDGEDDRNGCEDGDNGEHNSAFRAKR